MRVSVQSQPLNRTYAIVLGDSGVGKTSLAQQFAMGHRAELPVPTIGVDFFQKRVPVPLSRQNMASGSWEIRIWDTAGTEKFQALARAYYTSAGVALVVFDCTQRTSFDHVEAWVERLRENQVTNVPIVLVGNKADLRDRVVDHKEALTLARRLNAAYFETAAQTGHGVDEVFAHTAEVGLEAVTKLLVSVPVSTSSCC